MSEKQIRAGSNEGVPQTRLDKETNQLYYLDDQGHKVFISTPKGFTFDESGTLVPKKNAHPEISTPPLISEVPNPHK